VKSVILNGHNQASILNKHVIILLICS